MTDEACETFPAVTMVKALTGGPTAVGSGDYEYVYTITVTNRGAGAGSVRPRRQLELGDGVTVVSADIVNETPGSIVVNPAWNGTTTTAVVTGQPIAAATATVATVHTYRVTVVVEADPAITPEAADCTDDPGETGDRRWEHGDDHERERRGTGAATAASCRGPNSTRTSCRPPPTGTARSR